MSLTFQALAQADKDIWATPINLSHSGAASSPAIVAGPDGTLRIFWWDRFDGLMVAEATSGVWSEPVSAPIFLVETIEGETEEVEYISTPIKAMPRIVAGATGRAHAFWLGEADDETGARPLMHSSLAAGGTSWLGAGVVAESTVGFDPVANASGALHLVYLRALHTAHSPAGLYYRRSDDGGATWSTPAALNQSRYFRLLTPEDAHLRLAADDAGGVYATWDDPRLERALLAHSADGGVTWEEPQPVGAPDGAPQRGRVVVVPGGQTLLLWEEPRVEGGCGLCQASVSSLLAGAEGTAQQVLVGLAACPENERFLPVGQGQALMVSVTGGDALTLAAWDGRWWSEPRLLSFHFENPELGRQVHLADLQAALAPFPPDEESEQAAKTLIVVGTDDNGEVWITNSQVEALEPIFAPPTPTPRLTLPTPSESKVEAGPPRPVNLSRSGAASSPAIVAGADGTLRVFWWDQFDGLMVADGVIFASSVLSGTKEISTTLEIWSDPAPAPIFLVETVQNRTSESGTLEEEFVFTPIDTMPRIEADEAGRAHAFWLGKADGETGARPLMHSRLEADSISWSWAGVAAESAVSFDVAADSSGALHLAYLRAQHTPDAPAGLYYRRSDDGGLTWSPATALHQSRYFRPLSSETARLRLAAGDAGRVYVSWDDPRLERASFAHSADGGATWETLGPVGDPDGQPQRGRVVAVPGGEVLLLWEDARVGSGCSLLQASVNELPAGADGTGQRVLEGLTACPDNERFLPAGEGLVLMVAGSESDALTLAAWDGSQWSEPRRLSFSFKDTELGEQVYLSDLQAALVQLSPNGEGLADQALIAVGTDGKGDVWVTTSQMGALKMVFAPPPPWSAAVNFSESQALPGLPAMAADAEGRVHLLWSEAPAADEPGTALFYARWNGTQWTRPAKVLQSPEGGAEKPALAVVGDRLHAVWSGGQNGEIFYSRAFLRDAYAAGGWSELQPLPAPAPSAPRRARDGAGSGAGNSPDIAADAGGALHVVYALPLNEGRGIYHTRSDDGGENWSPAHQVFDAAAVGWAMADYPRLAIDRQGVLHVVWVRAALPGRGLPQGIYYARSSDGGQTWSEPVEVAEGAYAWPQVAASGPGQVHLLWNEAAGGRAWWHKWSTNDGEALRQGSGQGWTRPEQVRGFGEVPGPVGLASDGDGTLHLIGLGHDDAGEPALLYMTWDGENWGEREMFRLALDEGGESGAVAALLPALGRLDVAFRGEAKGEGETRQVGLWHTGRAVPTVVVTPAPTFTPHPTATPLPTPTPTVTPQPTPDFGSVLPPTASGSMDIPLPLLLGGGLAAVIVAGAFGARLLWAGRR